MPNLVLPSWLEKSGWLNTNELVSFVAWDSILCWCTSNNTLFQSLCVFQMVCWLMKTNALQCLWLAWWRHPQPRACPSTWRCHGSAKAAWTTSRQHDGLIFTDCVSLLGSSKLVLLTIIHFLPRDRKSVPTPDADMEDDQNGCIVLIQELQSSFSFCCLHTFTVLIVIFFVLQVRWRGPTR